MKFKFKNCKFYVLEAVQVLFKCSVNWLKHCILQGGEGDCFYVVGSGEFEVLATQVWWFLILI